jgi:4-oxalocrotonate tautomerase
MPHIVVKLWPGRTNEQKEQLSEAIVKAFKDVLNSSDQSISVAIEDVKKEDWEEQVYKPEILPNMEKLYKKPGYTM